MIATKHKGLGQTGIFSNYPISGADFLCAIPGAGFTDYCKSLSNREIYGDVPTPTGTVVTAPPAPDVSIWTSGPSSTQAAQQAAQDVSNKQVSSTQAAMQSFVDTNFPDTSTSLWDNPNIAWALFGAVVLIGATMFFRGR